MDKRLGAQLYTIRDFVQNAEDFDKSCKKIADIGYKTVQLSAIGPIEPQTVRNILDKYGLSAIVSHRPAKEYEEELDKLIEWHRITGCEIAGMGVMPTGFDASPDKIASFIEKYKAISKKIKEAGLVFAYHNHSFEFTKINGKYIFEMVAEETDPDEFKFILDIYWLVYAGINPVDFIKKYGKRIIAVHFKDLKIKVNEACICEVGEGNIDWDSVIKACDEAGVKYGFVEQDTCDGDPFDSLKISYDYLKNKGFL